MKTLLLMPGSTADLVLDAARLRRLTETVELLHPVPVTALAELDADLLARVEVVVTGWGSPLLDDAALDAMPRLRAVVHTAGTVRSLLGERLWADPRIVVTTAAEANAIPVAEFTLAQILLAGKRSLRQEAEHRRTRGHAYAVVPTGPGNHGGVVGLIGASRIGRQVAELLRPFDLTVLLADPYVPAEEIAALGAVPAGLPELFATSDVVSLHAPDVPSTQGMVTAELLARMRDGTTFVNTARPALVDLDALRAELVTGRLAAVLDVHDDLAPDDPLWDVPTVSLTPHLAGSQGGEVLRMGDLAIEELRRLGAGEPPLHPVDRTRRDTIA